MYKRQILIHLYTFLNQLLEQREKRVRAVGAVRGTRPRVCTYRTYRYLLTLHCWVLVKNRMIYEIFLRLLTKWIKFAWRIDKCPPHSLAAAQRANNVFFSLRSIIS